ncbi:hypothetical protein ACFXPW_18845 [Streptomyces goshikiensis]|uniref:hypothetical protein n=1 Tax=Streptomyces goshikiensis TaxID=1942 RepID=UPI0036BDFA75
MLEPAPRKERAKVAFALPAEVPPGRVPVVGDFAVTVEIPGESGLSRRYLAAGDYWFNDETGGDRDGRGGRFRL